MLGKVGQFVYYVCTFVQASTVYAERTGPDFYASPILM